MVPLHTLFYLFNVVTTVFGVYLKMEFRRRRRWLGLRVEVENKDNNKNKTKSISLGPSVFTRKAKYTACPKRRRSRRTHVFWFLEKKNNNNKYWFFEKCHVRYFGAISDLQ